MKIIVNGTDLSSAVMKVSKAISSKTTNPVLEGIKLSVRGDELTLSATDTEIAIEKTIRSETFLEGDTVVPGKLFAELVKKLETEDQVELNMAEEGRLKIVYGSSEVYLSVLGAEEFPVISKNINEKSFTLLQKDFKDAVMKTSFCCSTDESRPILKGCLTELKDNVMTCVALDGFRLAVAKKQVKGSTGDFKVIVPARSLTEITRLLEKDDEEITVRSEGNALKVEVDGTIFITRLLEGEFINYLQIVPKEFVTTVSVGRAALLNSLDRATVVARESKNLVKLDIKEGFVNISANSESGNVNETVNANMEGKDIVIAFNSKYLCDALRAAGDEFVNVYLNNPISPCVIKPCSGEDYLYLILPIRLNV